MPRPLLVPALFTLAACGILGPDRVLGSLESRSDFSVPDSVRAGEPFVATLITGGGGCHSKGSTDVFVDGNTALIVPYDRLRGDDICTTILLRFDHSVTLRFDTPGETRVIARVLDLRSGEQLELTELVEVY
ncbi:MAG TPA: PH domain-containing protein [Longimicrobiales bacterium]|nr:PH domain-containing protein [Longimicrobiales bacterium]